MRIVWSPPRCLVLQELEREQGEAKWLDIIEKDLHRQFPFHEMFAARGGHGYAYTHPHTHSGRWRFTH